MDADSAAFAAATACKYSMGTLHRISFSGDAVARRAAVLAIGMLGDVASNAVLGERLCDDDRRVRFVADDAMKAIWSRHGLPRHRQWLIQIERELQSARVESAIAVSTKLVAELPDHAEAYSFRGLARYHRGDLTAAIQDCQRALDLNPYHYAAAIGAGHCFLDLDEPILALSSFRKARAIFPDVEQVNIQISKLERLLRD